MFSVTIRTVLIEEKTRVGINSLLPLLLSSLDKHRCTEEVTIFIAIACIEDDILRLKSKTVLQICAAINIQVRHLHSATDGEKALFKILARKPSSNLCFVTAN